MGTKKKDLEIIYSLQWKNKPANGGDTANIIVCMYDIPATTLNWEIFKSYLLKNSGASEDDVKVSYITSNEREFPIESQTDFQIALYAFRRRARYGEVINLKLERISVQPSTSKSRKTNRSSSTIDVQTQIDETDRATSTTPSLEDNSVAPSWFILHMAQFKKEILEEVNNVVAKIKPPDGYSRITKADSKRRKLPTLLLAEPDISNRKNLKTLKKEMKLENKLEKLERTTKKIREKKMALIARNESDAPKDAKDVSKMGGMPINYQTTIPHMLGGEIYLHQWEVVNCGQAPWTEKTTLNFAWGSRALIPLEKIIKCPLLSPGESGIIAVRLQVPISSGEYKSYWYLHHDGQRFGNWLGCCLIVDDFEPSSFITKLPKFYNFGLPVENSKYEEFDITVEDQTTYEEFVLITEEKHFEDEELT